MSTNAANDGYYSIKQLQERYGDISRRTLYNWRTDKGFPAPVDSAKRLYSKKDVVQWEQREFGEVSNG